MERGRVVEVSLGEVVDWDADVDVEWDGGRLMRKKPPRTKRYSRMDHQLCSIKTILSAIRWCPEEVITFPS